MAITTTVTCDLCGRVIEKPDYLGKTIPIALGGDRYEVGISVDYPADAGKPSGDLDTCTECFWIAVKEAVNRHGVEAIKR
jgi:hypothetical protein